MIPLLAVVVLVSTDFHPGNFTGGGFFPKGLSIPKTLMTVIPEGGIVFVFTGFEQATQIGGESRNPQRDLPWAVIGSVLIAVIIYILVQLASTGALNPATIAHFHAWANLLAKDGPLESSPYYTLASVAGLAWLAWVLRFSAVVSPGSCGLIYITTTSRISYGMSLDGYLQGIRTDLGTDKDPGLLGHSGVHPGLPLSPALPELGEASELVTSATVLMYVGAPLALGALRKNSADLRRSYRLPAAGFLAPVAFVFSTLIVTRRAGRPTARSWSPSSSAMC